MKILGLKKAGKKPITINNKRSIKQIYDFSKMGDIRAKINHK